MGKVGDGFDREDRFDRIDGMLFDIPRCYRSTPLRTYPGLTANIHWRFAPRKEGKGTAGAVVFFTYPPHFEEALEGKSIPLFGSSPHSLAKDSLGFSFSPFKRGWLARRAI